ncbi:hypothetical protein E9993_17820 [Labilibacter sediminis]|nr:hypothetical protein E9993_17820 [Labilibacter sediminis]
MIGGSILSMIASLKNNERPKRKPLSSWNKGKGIPNEPKKLKYKELEEEDLNNIKERIRRQSLYVRKKRIIRLFSLISFTIIALILTFKFWLAEPLRQGIHERSRNYNAIRDSINNRTDSLYYKYLNEGFTYLNQQKYTQAKEILYEAYQIKPTEFEGIYMYTKALVFECKNEKKNCKSAKKSMDFLIYKYPENEEVKLLMEIYNE